ncbi:MAG: SRPBCC domain-containing protein [Reichenbachiella sp.]
MKQLYTEIVINASTEKVWEILTDFDKYSEWNPFVKSITGKFEVGCKLTATLVQPESKPMVIKPNILRIKKNTEFAWLGHLLIPGIFDGEHMFEMEVMDNGKTRFIQRERFKGILIPILWKMLDTKTRKGFESMNLALKKQAEK